MGKYIWKAESNDGWYEENGIIFDTKKDAYNNMRDAALEKMKWNTEFDEDFPEGTPIGYEVVFEQDKIVHESYSGVYTYTIVEV